MMSYVKYIYYMNENQTSEAEDRAEAYAIHYGQNLKLSAEDWVRKNTEEEKKLKENAKDTSIWAW